jgi:2-keto-4-pentenoate hydratase/2-oxohepta-3-ene-1,7-dioic acid hydratase in catechol pathway
VLIGRELRNADAETARQAVSGYGIALDLTLRDLQNELKKKGHPLGNRQSLRRFLPAVILFSNPRRYPIPRATDSGAADQRRTPPAGQHPANDGRYP